MHYGVLGTDKQDILKQDVLVGPWDLRLKNYGRQSKQAITQSATHLR
jgi:hypothetical protein